MVVMIEKPLKGDTNEEVPTDNMGATGAVFCFEIPVSEPISFVGDQPYADCVKFHVGTVFFKVFYDTEAENHGEGC